MGSIAFVFLKTIGDGFVFCYLEFDIYYRASLAFGLAGIFDSLDPNDVLAFVILLTYLKMNRKTIR